MYRILIIGGSRSGKTNVLLSLICHQEKDDDGIINTIYLYVKDKYASNYQSLISKRESGILKHFNDGKPFIEHFNDR